MQNKGRGSAIYEQIRSSILDGTYPEDARLPSEAGLCKRYQVSRPVVREALARLRVEGLVVSRQGSGSFVRKRAGGPDDDAGFAPVKNLDDINNCFDFRLALEGEAAFYAAQNRGAADLIAIETAMNRFVEATETMSTGETYDFAFHRAIAEASRIYFFPSVMDSMRRHVTVGMRLARELSRVDPRKRLRMVCLEHQSVFDSIRDQKPEAARASMRKHIDLSRRRLFVGQD